MTWVLIYGHSPYDVTSNDLFLLFTKKAPVKDAFVVLNKETGVSAQVEFQLLSLTGLAHLTVLCTILLDPLAAFPRLWIRDCTLN